MYKPVIKVSIPVVVAQKLMVRYPQLLKLASSVPAFLVDLLKLAETNPKMLAESTAAPDWDAAKEIHLSQARPTVPQVVLDGLRAAYPTLDRDCIIEDVLRQMQLEPRALLLLHSNYSAEPLQRAEPLQPFPVVVQHIQQIEPRPLPVIEDKTPLDPDEFTQEPDESKQVVNESTKKIDDDDDRTTLFGFVDTPLTEDIFG